MRWCGLERARRLSDIGWPRRRLSDLARVRARLLGSSEQLLDMAGTGAWLLDPESGELWWSRETCRVHGVPEGFVPALETALGFYPEDARETVAAQVRRCVADGEGWDMELPLRRADGRLVRVRTRGRAVTSPGGRRLVMGIFSDVSESHAHAEAHQRLQLVVQHMTNAAVITDPEGRTIWLNQSFTRLTGYTLADMKGMKPGQLLQGPETDPEDVRALAEAIRAARPICREIRNYNRDGRAYWVELNIAPIRDADGQLQSFVAISSDVTARHEAAEAARRELARRTRTETLLRDVIDGIPAALTVYDRDERLVLTNESYQHILPGNHELMRLGDTMETIVRRKVAADYYAPEIRAEAPEEVRAAWVADYLARHRSPDYSRVLQLSDGRWVQVSNARSTSGNIVTIRTDISRLKEAEAGLRHSAEHDSLTGLLNRPVLVARLEAECRKQLREGGTRGGALVLFDIDFFKAVNDGLGHAAGDALLKMVARRLGRIMRAGDTIARLGGDEFALLMPGLTDPLALNRLLDRLLAVQRRPVRLGRNRYTPSVSVGVTRWPMDGRQADTLLSHADAALYEAKRQGRGRHVLFDTALAGRLERRTRLADKLRVAIPAGQLEVALQPQLRLADNSISGFEALARWNKDGEWVPPQEFVGVAEDVGLAQALGAAVLDKALAAHAMLERDGLAPGLLAVNVSTAQLLSDEFLETLRRLLAQHGVSAGRLEMEITETVLLDRSIARIGETLEALRARGVSLSLDDFGTGYASLSHLTAFPVDRIKIDKSFTSAIGQDGDRGLIARSIIGLGRGLGLDVVAEGVETEAQKLFLLNRGCTAIQGYLVAPPMLVPAVRQWLAARRGMRAA